MDDECGGGSLVFVLVFVCLWVLVRCAWLYGFYGLIVLFELVGLLVLITCCVL